ncbi:MAG: serpin family protein, partial [Planctomycetia bacterium]|nr:serpin family protein [Planctomycetia bacterium]
DATFHATAGRDVKVPMMAQSGTFRYHDGSSFRALELPYQGGARSMIVLLPKPDDGLGALEASLTEDNLAGWLKGLVARRVDVEMPRFTLTEPMELRETLSAMGMPDAFDPARADFSGMTGRRDLSISAVIHKAFVAVNEAGTEAAAATGVVMTRTSVGAPSDPIPFRVDHPFVVLIRDRATGSILFLGRVVDPKA